MWVFNKLYSIVSFIKNINLNNIIYSIKKIWNVVCIPLVLYGVIKNNNKINIIILFTIYNYSYPKLIQIYNDKYYYFEKILDIYFTIKLYLIKKKNNNNNDFNLIKVELYINLNNKINVTTYFLKNNINYIDKNLIKNIYADELIVFDNNDDIRLKIYFEYLNNFYIIYFPYNVNINNDKIIEYYLPYPIFTKKIMEDYRNDIILPYHNVNIKKKLFYSLFHIDCKDILTVEINNITNDKLKEYFELIKTPFLDYGILYNVPIKLKWILSENNINIFEFEKFYFKFLNSYLCEEEMDLKEQELIMNKNDLNNIFITDRIKQILEEKEYLIKKNI
jgi:hypothetical protein